MLERLHAKRNNPANKQALAARKAIIEPVLAWMEQQLGFDRWTVFGLEGVRAPNRRITIMVGTGRPQRFQPPGPLMLREFRKGLRHIRSHGQSVQSNGIRAEIIIGPGRLV